MQSFERAMIIDMIKQFAKVINNYITKALGNNTFMRTDGIFIRCAQRIQIATNDTDQLIRVGRYFFRLSFKGYARLYNQCNKTPDAGINSYNPRPV